ncbi:MAG: hypothetical protein LJF04_10870 [Gemmatimonadetes bacterium]|nr:hypothetical protein [Gemmatimonadota bacterium]
MTDPNTTAEHKDADAALAPPPDGLNEALIDAKQTFIITVISAALFIGAVFVFIL